jgi:Zn-dependent protease with chaperone function
MTENSNYIHDERIPLTPYLLILLALLFVPGVYLVLLLSAIAPFLMWYGLPEKSGSDNNLQRMIVLGAIISASACLRGIWFTMFRKPRFELALSIDLGREHKLNSFILEICRTLGTKPPDAVILLAEPSFFVQKGKLKILDGVVKKKVLAIGLPLLSVLSLNELRAILVHEFAHFTGNDTLYSSFVLPVYLGTQESINRLRAEIKSKSENLQGIIVGFFIKIPMFLPLGILYTYLKLFQLLDMKLSRIREKRADVIAALVCGSQTFSDSLKKVVRISRSFFPLSQDQIVDLLKDDKVYINYYSVFRNSLPQIWDSSLKFELEALSEKDKLFSSHPNLKTRLQYIPYVLENYFDTQLATSLIENLDTYEKTLTERYTEYISIVFSKEVIRRKNLSKPQVALIKCPNCFMRTYEGTHCHICGKRLKSIFDYFDN